MEESTLQNIKVEQSTPTFEFRKVSRLLFVYLFINLFIYFSVYLFITIFSLLSLLLLLLLLFIIFTIATNTTLIFYDYY